MALRVLLADESTTIKKVMQLALQDFAVEVKSVHSGVDVLEVARAFGPDIIFADVLLQKKNGYEVAASLKADVTLKPIPIVLMWSSFMDLDEKLAAGSGAERRLEKPFDVENLRQIVLELVPKTRSHRLAHFLKFPESITADFVDEEGKKAPAPAKTPPPAAAPTAPAAQKPAEPKPEPVAEKTPASNWNMDSFEDMSDFSTSETSVGLVENDPDDEAFSEMRIIKRPATEKTATRPTPSPATETVALDDRDPWSHQDLSRFKVELPPITGDADGLELQTLISREPQADPLMTEFPESSLPAEPSAAEELGFQELAIEGAEIPIEMRAEESREEIELPALTELDQENELVLLNPLNEGEPESRRTRSADGPIPQLSADRLEEIIRAQSRDIIESVVRRVVPELANDIIRKELERLLEEAPR